MAFRDNLIQKMAIDRLAEQVRRSLAPTEGDQRIDAEAMRVLLAMTPFQYRRERDLDLYCVTDDPAGHMVLVLDNGLALYRTTVEDVALRKSPTLKEMVNIRNAVKILNDKDVLVSRKTDTLQHIQDRLIGGLDLSYSASDIEALAADGRAALRNNYADGVIEMIALFNELLGFREAPKPFRAPHHQVWGDVLTLPEGEIRMTPIILLDRIHNHLKMITTPIGTLDKAGMEHLRKVVKGDVNADLEGEAVFTDLAERTLADRPPVS